MRVAIESRQTGQIIDAHRPLYVSKSILKAQNEQVYKVSTPILVIPRTLQWIRKSN